MFSFRSSRPGSPIILLSIFLSLMYLAAGSAGLAPAGPLKVVFAKIGVEHVSGNMAAIIDIVGALGMLVGASRFYAAVLLVCLMEVAAVEHLYAVHGDPVPSIVLLLLTGIVACCTRPAADIEEGSVACIPPLGTTNLESATEWRAGIYRARTGDRHLHDERANSGALCRQ